MQRVPTGVIESNWKFAGYRDGESLPTESNYSQVLDLTSSVLWGSNAIAPSSTVDQSVKLQAIIDSLDTLYPNRSYSSMVKLVLPTGTIRIENQICLHTSFVTLAGQGKDSTILLFQPNLNTRYDVDLSGSGTQNGEDFDLGLMTYLSSNAAWQFPGRACIRVQTKKIHSSYNSEVATAPTNRKDFYQGSVNFPWKRGINVKQSTPIAATKGQNTIPLDSSPLGIFVGSYVLLFAANTKTWYNSIKVLSQHQRGTPIVRTRLYRVVAVDTVNNIITIDKPLEFDVPANQTSDGDTMINQTIDSSYYSLVVGLEIVLGVGIENLQITQPMTNQPGVSGTPYNLTTEQAVFNYNNMAAEYTMHGIVLKWCANCFVRGCKTFYTGSHAIVTEFVKNIQVQDNYFEGSWNKGKGGNGYVRFSKCFDSIIQRNTVKDLRHITFQWSSSLNVMRHNTLSCDINLHGGWERRNIIEQNTSIIPYLHQSPGDTSTWYPIWWSTGNQGGGWSAATGEKNVFWNNRFLKQRSANGQYFPYTPYQSRDTVYIFGWDKTTKNGSSWQHIGLNNSDVNVWSGNEAQNYTLAANQGVNAQNVSTKSLYESAKSSNAVAVVLPDIPAYSPPLPQMRISTRYSTKTLLSGKVSAISDFSGNANALTAAAGKEVPLGTLNGYDTLSFNNLGVLSIPSAIGSNKTTLTYFMVLKVNAAASTQERILEFRFSGGGGWQLYLNSTFNAILLGFFNNSGAFSAGITASVAESQKGSWIGISFTINYTTGVATLWVNDFDLRSLSTGLVVPLTFSSALLGGRSTGATMFSGEVAEISYYNTVVSDYDRFTIIKRLLADYKL